MAKIIHIDQGEINARLIMSVASDDMGGIESASRKLLVSLCSPEGKRLFLRYFNAMQRRMHFISVIARHSLPSVDISAIEGELMALVDLHVRQVDSAIAHAARLLEQNGVSSLASYDAQPLAIEVRVISAFGRHLLDLILKIDQLMLMLETLALDLILVNGAVHEEKSAVKKRLRKVVGAVRSHSARLAKQIPVREQPQIEAQN